MTSRRKRTFKAYWVTFRVAFSYIGLFFLSKVLGKGYYNRRITKLHHRNALRVKKAILQLGGLFVKVGQLISILSNMLPQEFRGPLESLQNKVPPRDPKDIRQHLEKELGQPIDAVFSRFDDTPLAAASIGQAHRAQLKDGTEVVVKIQHANIEEIAQIDLEIIEKLVLLNARFFDIKGMEHVYQQVRQMIKEELDYGHEAEAMQEIRTNLATEPNIIVPKVYTKCSSAKVIVSEYCEGTRITDLEQLKNWKLDLETIAQELVAVYCKMIFVDGIYHADPHPGNILISPSGKLILLDFGAVAQLSTNMQEGIMDLILATAKNDLEGIVAAMKKAGFVGKESETIKIAERLIEIASDFFQNEIQLEGLNFNQIDPDAMFKVVAQVLGEFSLKELANTFQIPKDWILLNRALILVMGICNQLAPKLNPIEIATPYLKDFILSKNKDFSKLVINTIKGQLTTLISLPNDLKKALQKIHKNDLQIKVQELNNGFKLLYLFGQQVLCAILSLSSFYLAYSEIKPFSKPFFSYTLITLGVVMAYAFFKLLLSSRRLYKKL
ncbi:MAG: AarF/ABC1/UbiB kinase family protein [Aureispira sp.]|nr:AarF/ABC1/UbiB kinase family protein [Aureispira sp.]